VIRNHFQLSDKDREYLKGLLSKGQLRARVFKRANGLLQLQQGKTLIEVAANLGVSRAAVADWRDGYKKRGLNCLEEAPRPGRPVKIDGDQRAKITALACSQAPQGHAKWNLRLLAEKIIELGICPEISHQHVNNILKKNELQPHLKKTWCLGTLNAAFLAQMEQVLWVYGQPYDPQYPNVCFDERPCFLIGEAVAPLPMESGRVRKEHYAYEKNGSCALLAALEPLTGKRVAQVFPQRTKKEYTQFCQALSAAYPEAKKIRLVQDNLNTHNTSSFYENLPAEEAFALAQRFEFYYTPKSGSWLNMIEIEFSALARQCLDRRIPTLQELESELLALVKERSDKAIKIDWQFSIKKAREKFRSHYSRILTSNNQCQNN
jgi:transposase